MFKEEWRAIEGYENYKVSNTGKIFNGKKNLAKRKNGTYQLAKGGKKKSVSISRLVWKAFVGEIPDGMQVVRIDGDVQNCNLDNLKLGTPRDSANARVMNGNNFSGRIDLQEVDNMRMMYNNGSTVTDIWRQYGDLYSRASINAIVYNRCYVDPSYKPKLKRPMKNKKSKYIAKLNKQTIIDDYVNSRKSMEQLAKEYDTSAATINMILKGGI